jgi:hypothetical protein
LFDTNQFSRGEFTIMNKEVTEHLEVALNQVRALFLKGVTRIEAIKPGEKVPATDLAAELAAEQGQTGPQLYPLIKVLLNNYPGVIIRRGAHGGIYRPLATETQELDKPATNADDTVVQE